MEKLAMIFSNFASQESARDVLKVLMEENIATCGNIMAPHFSIYPRKGEIHEETETAVIFKAPIENKDKLIARLRELHPYELPAIIAIDAQATDDYVAWLGNPSLT
jgi:periplasmic divalent cation tolerance protein